MEKYGYEFTEDQLLKTASQVEGKEDLLEHISTKKEANQIKVKEKTKPKTITKFQTISDGYYLNISDPTSAD